MQKKTSSAMMQTLLHSLHTSNHNLHVIVFTDDQILHSPVTTWPIVDSLVAFYSSGFPVDKAIDYVRLRRPFVVNDLAMQKCLLDRRKVYQVLREAGVGVLRSVAVDRSKGDWVEQNEGGDGDVLSVYINCGGSNNQGCGSVGGDDDNGCGDQYKVVRIQKPFVEKPIDAGDHNVYVYFRGGGVRKLFRKTKVLSSVLDGSRRHVRTGGSYIYEPYYEPRGKCDVKAYGVGGDLFYAETRKAPTVDGIVERGPNGREVRKRTELTEMERNMCAKVARAFRFFEIGFDLLRVGDRTFVIDVNGWSLSKNSTEFAMICGARLAKHIVRNVRW